MDFLSSISSIVSAEVMNYITFAFTVIGAAAVGAANLPRAEGASEKWYYKLLDLIAQNYNKAKNQ